MPTVHLIRHGQASFGAAEYDELSPLGIQQAEATGASLRRRDVRPVRAVAGSLRRQRGTATACLAAADLDGLAAELIVDSRWNEYDHLALIRSELAGAGSPQDGPEFQRALDRALLRWIEAGPGAAGTEAASWDAFARGVDDALEELFAQLGSGGSAVVFTSAGPIAAVCGRVLGLPPAGCVAMNRVVVNGAITKVVRGRSGTSLVTFNDHAHFDGVRDTLLTYR